MADINSIDAFGDNPIVTWDDGDRIPLVKKGNLWIPSRAHEAKESGDNSSGGTSGDDGAGGSGGVQITAEMIKAGCVAGGYPNPTYHDQGGYAGVAKMFNDACDQTHRPQTKKQAACMVGECCQETGGYWYWAEEGGSGMRYAPYYGRGYIQVTWKENYQNFGNWAKKYGLVNDAGMFVSNPDSLLNKKYVAATGIWEFDIKHSGKTLWQIADSSSSPWHRVSRAINTGNPDAGFPAYGEALRARIIDAILKVTPEPVSGSSGGGAGKYKPVDDYPYKTASWHNPDPWNFYYRECVSFCCWRVRGKTNIKSFNNSWKTHWGNGAQWLGAARRAGIPVYSTPKPGDIACRLTGTAGHVAYVTSVSGNNFSVEEYNHNWSNGYGHVYGTRKTSVSTTGANGFAGYIRFPGA